MHYLSHRHRCHCHCHRHRRILRMPTTSLPQPPPNSSRHHMFPSLNYYSNSLDQHKNWLYRCSLNMHSLNMHSCWYTNRVRRCFHFLYANVPVWSTVAFAMMYLQFVVHYRRSKLRAEGNVDYSNHFSHRQHRAIAIVIQFLRTLDLEHEFNRTTFDEWRSFSPNILSNGEWTGCLRYCTIEIKRIDKLSFASASIRLIVCSIEFLWHSCVFNWNVRLEWNKLNGGPICYLRFIEWRSDKNRHSNSSIESNIYLFHVCNHYGSMCTAFCFRMLVVRRCWNEPIFVYWIGYLLFVCVFVCEYYILSWLRQMLQIISSKRKSALRFEFLFSLYIPFTANTICRSINIHLFTSHLWSGTFSCTAKITPYFLFLFLFLF